MRAYQDQLADESVGAAYRAAHLRYLDDRRELAAQSGSTVPPAIEHISAGGMPDRVKCLHALLAHSLACGPGVNPIGDATAEQLGNWWQIAPCALRWGSESEEQS